MQRNSGRKSAKFIAFLGLLLALAVTLAFFESMLPGLPLLPTGIKLGLSNIVTMYCLLFLGFGPAVSVAVMKSLFVLSTRGPIAAFMSISGGLSSVLVMLLVIRLLPTLSQYFVSIAGAVFHNVGQLGASTLILKTPLALYYLPVMVISGVVMGVVTGILLRLVMPYLKNVDTSFK